MDQMPNLQTKTGAPRRTILIIISNLVILSVGFFAGYSLNSSNGGSPVLGILGGNPNNSYEAGWNAAKTKLEQSGILRSEPNEIFTITGKIISVSGNKINLKSDPVVNNPLAEQAPEERIVTVTENTKIIKQTAKSPEKLAAEMEKYRQDTANIEPGKIPPPPAAFTEEKLKISDLKTEDIISVASGQNIKMAAEFEASEIRLTITPERPAVPQP